MKKFWALVATIGLLFGMHTIVEAKKEEEKKEGKNWLEKVAYFYIEGEKKPFAVFDRKIAGEKLMYYCNTTKKPIGLAFYNKEGKIEEVFCSMPTDLFLSSINYRFDVGYEKISHAGVAKHVAAAKKAKIERYGKKLFENLEKMYEEGKINYEEYLDFYEAAVQEYEWYANKILE